MARQTRRLILLAAAASVALLAACSREAAAPPKPAFKSVDITGAEYANALDLTDADGKARTLEYGVADETAWRVGLSCGGRIRVYVERID